MKKIILTATMFALAAAGPPLWAQASDSTSPERPQRIQKRERIHVPGTGRVQAQQAQPQGPTAQNQATEQPQWRGQGRGPRSGVGPGMQCPYGLSGMRRQGRQGCCGQQARMGRGLRGGRGR
jgi:hypothetical protein